MSAALIALTIKYNASDLTYYGAVLFAFVCGAIFVVSYQPNNAFKKALAVAAYFIFSFFSVSVIGIFLFCSLKTCS